MAGGRLLPDGTYLLSSGHTVAPNCVVGSGHLLSDGHLLGDAILLGDGHLLGDSILLSDGYAFGSGHLLCDGHLLGDGHLLSDSFANEVEPTSMKFKEEQVLLQGESALPTSVNRLAASSPLYPRP